MGSLEKRLAALEGRIPPPEDKGAELRRALKIGILNEIGRLKSLRGHGIHRIGEPHIPPFDPVGEALGYPYTHGEFIEFAVRSVLEREREEAPEILTREVVEVLIENWTEAFRRMFVKAGVSDPDEISEHGPPDPAPPHLGSR
jgi:hypothetical protein